MKLPPRQVEGFLRRPPAEVRVVLLYGPDRGLAAERRRLLLTAWLDDPGDPLALTVLEGDQLRSDPARLLDEVQAYAMLGGRRVVRVTEATDGLAKLVQDVLALATTEAPLLLEAGELGAGSSLRKLCEGRPNAAAIPCYRLDERDLEQSVRGHLERLGLRAEPAAFAFLVAQLGADAAITRTELDKLDLYLGDRRQVRLEDAAACVGDSSTLELDALVHATTMGDPVTAMRLIERLLAAKQAPVAIVRVLQGHWQRLWRLRIAVEGGASIAGAVDGARPPIFFKAKPKVTKALGRLTAVDLRYGLHALVEAERRLKTTGLPAPDVLRHTVLSLAAPRQRGPVERIEG